MMVRALGTTMSGRPGNRLSHTLNLHPAAKIRLRTRTSGFVSRHLILLIILLRCSGVILSIIAADYITRWWMPRWACSTVPVDDKTKKNASQFLQMFQGMGCDIIHWK